MDCSLCGKKYSNINQLSTHLSKIHPDSSKEEFYIKYINPNVKLNCRVCNNKLKFKNLAKGFYIYCSTKCKFKDPEFIQKRTEKTKKTNLEKYGVEYITQNKQIRDKINKTNLEKYGVKEFLSKENNECREKIKTTCLEKYGVDNPLKSDIILEQIKQTNLKRYGFENPFNNPTTQDNIKKTNLEKHGVKYTFQSDAIKQKIKETNIKRYGKIHYLKTDLGKAKLRKKSLTRKFNKILNSPKFTSLTPLFNLDNYNGVKDERYKFQCNDCITTFEDHLDNGRIPRCYVCDPLPYTSKYENEIVDFIKSILSIDCNISTSNRSIISPLELDIYLPEYNLAIEFNGLYWHSELQGKDSQYHLNKTNLCLNKGIDLLHIFEDEWVYKSDIVKSTIKEKLNLNKIIKCNDCIIKYINKRTSRKFLNKNNIDGYTKSDTNIGYFYKDELVFVALIKENIVTRFGSKLDHSVIDYIRSIDIPILINKRHFKMNSQNTILTSRDPDFYYIDDNFKNRYNKYSNDYTVKIWDCGHHLITKTS